MTDHILDSVWPTISTERWESLTEEQQDWLMEAIEAGRVVTETEMMEQEASAVQELEDAGLKIVYPDIEAFRAYSLKKYEESGQTADWDMDLYEEIQALGK